MFLSFYFLSKRLQRVTRRVRNTSSSLTGCLVHHRHSWKYLMRYRNLFRYVEFDSFITARVRSTRKGNVLTLVCMSVHTGESTHIQPNGGGVYPHLRTRGNPSSLMGAFHSLILMGYCCCKIVVFWLPSNPHYPLIHPCPPPNHHGCPCNSPTPRCHPMRLAYAPHMIRSGADKANQNGDVGQGSISQSEQGYRNILMFFSTTQAFFTV